MRRPSPSRVSRLTPLLLVVRAPFPHLTPSVGERSKSRRTLSRRSDTENPTAGPPVARREPSSSTCFSPRLASSREYQCSGPWALMPSEIDTAHGSASQVRWNLVFEASARKARGDRAIGADHSLHRLPHRGRPGEGSDAGGVSIEHRRRRRGGRQAQGQPPSCFTRGGLSPGGAWSARMMRSSTEPPFSYHPSRTTLGFPMRTQEQGVWRDAGGACQVLFLSSGFSGRG